MKTLSTNLDYQNSKSNDKLPCECYSCKSTFYKKKKEITFELNHNIGYNKYCSKSCQFNGMSINGDNRPRKIILKCFSCEQNFEKSLIDINRTKNNMHFCSISCANKKRKMFYVVKDKINNAVCKNCQKHFFKKVGNIKQTKNNFCSRSCAAYYNNKHKNFGTRRSKLEIYLEKKLNILYPDLLIHYNKKNAINSELDIYIPSLKIAFEINGILHYKPIYGLEKLNKIQENDKSKKKECKTKKIALYILNTSDLKVNKEELMDKFLNIITKRLKKIFKSFCADIK